MEEKELKTTLKQRIIISVIAIVMVGSIIASYAAIVINGSKNGSGSTDSGVSEEKIAQYSEEYVKKSEEFKKISEDDFEKFSAYRSEIKAYNETTANENGVQTRDLVKGDGQKLAEGDTNYLAYYVGWCADETVFDSSFDDAKNPTMFRQALDASLGMIEGWNQGVVGMRLGGVREITIPGELAYADKTEICGGYNKPLKFLVMVVANEDPLKTASKEVEEASMKLQYAQYGIDYDELYSE